MNLYLTCWYPGRRTAVTNNAFALARPGGKPRYPSLLRSFWRALEAGEPHFLLPGEGEAAHSRAIT
jgi:hypothetical protein